MCGFVCVRGCGVCLRPNNTCYRLFSYSNLHLLEPQKRREISVKSTKLKYKNKGLKLKSIYEHNLHVHPELWSRVALLWQCQYSFYGKKGSFNKPNALFGRARSLSVARVRVRVLGPGCGSVPGLKLNSKKIEGRLLERHSGSYLSPSASGLPGRDH